MDKKQNVKPEKKEVPKAKNNLPFGKWTTSEDVISKAAIDEARENYRKSY